MLGAAVEVGAGATAFGLAGRAGDGAFALAAYLLFAAGVVALATVSHVVLQVDALVAAKSGSCLTGGFASTVGADRSRRTGLVALTAVRSVVL